MKKAKFYGVKVGFNQGVYNSWDECKKQVLGFRGAKHKSFASSEEAAAYVYGDLVPTYNKALEEHTDVFINGKSHREFPCYGWAFVANDKSGRRIYDDSGFEYSLYFPGFIGELRAAMEAVSWARRNKVGTITIHHDFPGISEWANGNWKSNVEITRFYAQFMHPQINWIKFVRDGDYWGIAGNIVADTLAQEALDYAAS
jgi:ribonuclease H-related protein